MAILRNRYHERVWFLGRKAADPDETIEVPDSWVEDRDADGVLQAALDPEDMFWERVDGPGVARAEIDAATAPAVAADEPAPEPPASEPVPEAEPAPAE